MKPRRNFKIILIALLLAAAVVGFGYRMTASAKTGQAQAAATAAVSAVSPMVPGNFSDLAERVRTGVVNIQVSKKVSSARQRSAKWRRRIPPRRRKAPSIHHWGLRCRI